MLPSVLSGWRALLQGDRWALATPALLAVAVLVVAATFRDYGSTWDERFQAELGRDVVAWFASGGSDPRALSGGSKGNLHLYGPAFEVAAELAGRALPFNPLETRHLLNALVALVGVAGAARLARRLGGHRAAFLAAALLVTTPSWWGHGFANSKDNPFAAAYPWLLLALLRAADELPRTGCRRIAAAGAALGAALAVRPGALILLLPLLAGLFAVRLLPPLLRASARDRPESPPSPGWRGSGCWRSGPGGCTTRSPVRPQPPPRGASAGRGSSASPGPGTRAASSSAAAGPVGPAPGLEGRDDRLAVRPREHEHPTLLVLHPDPNVAAGAQV